MSLQKYISAMFRTLSVLWQYFCNGRFNLTLDQLGQSSGFFFFSCVTDRCI